jgi:MoaA/NifB/PqqE/SkfB family radical SAM enzyme
MNFWPRAVRHARITLKNYLGAPAPPFFILFINSICNQKCEHCFYWRSLNSKDDLTFEEIVKLSRSLGRIENLNLSGGEPFLRPEFSEICKQFIRQNGVRQIYVPTNGTFLERTVRHVRAILEEKDLDLFVVEHSLDGMPEFHDHFRGQRDAFAKSIQTYDALAALQENDPRLRIHAISTATDLNMDEIRRLTTYLFERCPRMDHHNLAMIRGDRKNPALRSPQLKEYQELYEYVQRLWTSRERGRYGSSVEPLLQWAKGQTAAKEMQVIPCRAGVLTGVVYANGDVSVCENHDPIGNLRGQSFPEIWGSPRAQALRQSIRRKECHCTNEVFLWPSIVYQPLQLFRALFTAKPWRAAPPLAVDERAFVPLDAVGPILRPNAAKLADGWKPDQVLLPMVSERPD